MIPTTRLRTIRRVGAAYRQVFASPSGRTVLKDMIHAVGLYRQTGAVDVAELQYREGARDLVRRTLKMVKLTDDQLEHLMSEAVDE